MSSWFNFHKGKIKCYKCGGERSKDLSQACPECGYKPKDINDNQPSYMGDRP